MFLQQREGRFVYWLVGELQKNKQTNKPASITTGMGAEKGRRVREHIFKKGLWKILRCSLVFLGCFQVPASGGCAGMYG